MGFQVSEDGGVTILSIDDARIDAQVVHRYMADLEALIKSGKTRILVDLEHVQFVDSSGLNVILFGARTAQAHQGAFKLARPQAQVRGLLEMTRVIRMIPVFATLEEALASFT